LSKDIFRYTIFSEKLDWDEEILLATQMAWNKTINLGVTEFHPSVFIDLDIQYLISKTTKIIRTKESNNQPFEVVFYYLFNCIEIQIHNNNVQFPDHKDYEIIRLREDLNDIKLNLHGGKHYNALMSHCKVKARESILESKD